MSAAKSIPPVLSVELAEAETVRRAQNDLNVLMHFAGMQNRAKTVTTITPHHIVVAGAVLIPAIVWAGRELMSRMPEFCEERFGK